MCDHIIFKTFPCEKQDSFSTNQNCLFSLEPSCKRCLTYRQTSLHFNCEQWNKNNSDKLLLLKNAFSNSCVKINFRHIQASKKSASHRRVISTISSSIRLHKASHGRSWPDCIYVSSVSLERLNSMSYLMVSKHVSTILQLSVWLSAKQQLFWIKMDWFCCSKPAIQYSLDLTVSCYVFQHYIWTDEI